ncbi:MAG: PIN domain-containing protein [Rhizobacter sp.]
MNPHPQAKVFKVLHKSAAVLDTNVVLDWLVFGNPQCAPLVQAIEQGHLRWLVTEPMRDELAHVLGRGVVDAWRPDLDRLWESWRRLSETVKAPVTTGEALRLRCTDADDQKFVDLALSNAQWLISRDRAVLKLARRAQRLGVRVATPERWIAE